MMEDVNAGIAWVLKRIRHYGGDPDRVYLVGQSCGAQLSMMCLVTQVCVSASSKQSLVIPRLAEASIFDHPTY